MSYALVAVRIACGKARTSKRGYHFGERIRHPHTSCSIIIFLTLFLPVARCVCRQAAGKGCRKSYPFLDSPDPSKLQACAHRSEETPVAVVISVRAASNYMNA